MRLLGNAGMGQKWICGRKIWHLEYSQAHQPSQIQPNPIQIPPLTPYFHSLLLSSLLLPLPKHANIQYCDARIRLGRFLSLAHLLQRCLLHSSSVPFSRKPLPQISRQKILFPRCQSLRLWQRQHRSFRAILRCPTFRWLVCLTGGCSASSGVFIYYYYECNCTS